MTIVGHLHCDVASVGEGCDARDRARGDRIAESLQQARDTGHGLPKHARVPDVDRPITSSRVHLTPISGPACLQ